MSKQTVLRFGKIAFDVALLCLVVVVIGQNRVLVSRLKRLNDVPGAVVGQRVRNLAGVALDGGIKPIELPEAGQRLLVIGLSPRCPACRANQSGWNALASALKQRGDWRVNWVSRDPLDETRGYFNQLGISPLDAFADPPYRTYAQLGLLVVPRMVAIIPGGHVDKVWTGTLATEAWRDVFSYFEVPLPSSLL